MKLHPSTLFFPALAGPLLAAVMFGWEPAVLSQDSAPAEKSTSVQASSAKAPRGSISGRVIADSGAGLMGATIRIRPVGNAGSEAYSARTDQDGKFRQTDLPAGSYTVTASAPGYISEREDGGPKFYRPGDTITINLIKGGVVSGAVTNTSGEPVIGVPVMALKVRDAAGRPAPAASGRQERRTDDRGLYRIYGLESGSYLIMAGGAVHSSNVKTPFDRDVPTYSPSSTRDTAAEIQVRAGEETAGVDIRYRGEPGRAVSGVITGAIGANSESGAEVTIYRANSDSAEAVVEASQAPPHAFAIYGIADGEYDLIARGDNSDGEAVASAVTHVSVRGTDAGGVTLAVAPLARIAGRVVLESLPPEAASDCKEKAAALLQEAVITLRRYENKEAPPSHFPSTVYAAPDEKGNFSISELTAGTYHLETRLPADDWFLRSIASESPRLPRRSTGAAPKRPGDAAPIDPFSIKAGDSMNGVTVTIARGAAGLSGRLVSKEGFQRPPRLRVFLIPADPEYSGDVLRYAESSLGGDGGFTFANIAPGRYWAVPSLLEGEMSRDGNPYPVAWSATNRKALLGEASSGGNRESVIELKPCQRVSDYIVRYRK
jgi:hypothetical protein